MSQFTSTFVKFPEPYKYDITSPCNPKSNGHAEAALKSIKKLGMKATGNCNLNNDEHHEGLLEYINTPILRQRWQIRGSNSRSR